VGTGAGAGEGAGGEGDDGEGGALGRLTINTAVPVGAVGASTTPSVGTGAAGTGNAGRGSGPPPNGPGARTISGPGPGLTSPRGGADAEPLVSSSRILGSAMNPTSAAPSASAAKPARARSEAGSRITRANPNCG
jgi:hypothetical protein